MNQYDPTHDLKVKVCHLDHGPLILPYISQTIWWMSVIFSDNEKVWPNHWPQSKYRSTWPIFHGLVINWPARHDLVDWAIRLNTNTNQNWYNGSVWHRDWPQVYVVQWPVFYGPVILLHSLKTIWWRNVVLGIMDQCDTKIDLLKYMGFVVHWVCLLSLS